MAAMMGKVLSVNIADKKGQKKSNIGCGLLIENFGLQADAHAGTEIRQVSLLATESIEKIRAKGLNVQYGDFAENITTEGIDLPSLSIGAVYSCQPIDKLVWHCLIVNGCVIISFEGTWRYHFKIVKGASSCGNTPIKSKITF
jgi:hypothetical protein